MEKVVENGILYRLHKGKREAVVLGFYRPKDYSLWGKWRTLDSFNLSIPSGIVHEGLRYSVVEIKKEAFQHKKIGNVTVPSTIRKIGDYAFAQSSITSFNRQSAVNSIQIDIGEMAFNGCHELMKVTFNGPVKIGHYSFMSCPKLEMIDSKNFINLPEDILKYTNINKIFISNILLDVSKNWNRSSKIKDIYFDSAPSIEVMLELFAENQECAIHCDAQSPIVNLAFEGYSIIIEGGS